MKHIIISILFMICTNSLFADNSKLHLLHINGLNTIRDKAGCNLKVYQRAAITTPNVLWDIVYNPTQSGDEWSWMASIKGFIDVWLQKWHEGNHLPTLDEFTQQAMQAQNLDYLAGSNEYEQFKSSLIEQFQQLLLDDGGKNMETIVDEFHNIVPIQYASVLNLLRSESKADYSKNNDYVIFLPHSQGNIYANNLYNYLTQTEKFSASKISIFGFASPAKTEYGQMSCNSSVPNYITSTNDSIIAWARLMFGEQDILPNNITIPKNDDSTSGHSLIENYLSDRNSVNAMSSFINITSNNCFKELHPYEHIATVLNVGGKIIYDKSSKSFVQFTNNSDSRTICELSLDGSNGWVCATNSSTTITSINQSSLSTDASGRYYMIGYNSQYVPYLITYQHGVGFISEESLTGDSPDGGSLYYSNGSLYSVYMNAMTRLNIRNLSLSKYAVFKDIYMNGVSTMAIDSADNIYIAPPVPSYMNPVQLYSQGIESGSPILLFGPRVQDYIISDLTVANDTLFACGGRKTYYRPINSSVNATWLVLNTGCSQIVGDSENLFTTYGSGLYRYKL